MQICKAKSKGSGKQCKQPAIAGGTVCRYHGGAAPQVQRSAFLRLAALVDPSIKLQAAILAEARRALMAKTGESKVPFSVANDVAKDVLNRNGLRPKDEKKLDNSGAEELSTVLASFKFVVDGKATLVK